MTYVILLTMMIHSPDDDHRVETRRELKKNERRTPGRLIFVFISKKMRQYLDYLQNGSFLSSLKEFMKIFAKTKTSFNPTSIELKKSAALLVSDLVMTSQPRIR